ncbi:MAG TPA: hypothetical protein VGR14_10725 [Verrucomicrobiae bacterium]|jgi:hypothetical protein|nr:hypothetical protein [Verrucomicrobiae bacterium]
MLTPLEKAVLEMMLDKAGEPFETIRQQLAHASVGERKFSGVGFFTNFVVPEDIAVRRDLRSMEIGDVGAEIAGLQLGAGFLLFIRDGVVSFLEGFTYDESWPERTDEFRIFRHSAS